MYIYNDESSTKYLLKNAGKKKIMTLMFKIDTAV